jgi:hypothetical protein
MSCRNSSVTGRHGNLMKIRHDISRSINSGYRRSLMAVDFQASDIVRLRA